MTEAEIRGGLDDNNQHLVSEIEKLIPVRFTVWNETYYECHVHKNNGELAEAEIKCKEPISQAKIAHELLHAKISLVLGDIGIMYTIDNPNDFFNAMMAIENASMINNACEHLMSYPEFIDMGYDEAEFFESPEDIDARRQEIDKLYRNGLKDNGHYESRKVFSYLALLFSFLFYPNEDTFKREVKKLQKIDIKLYVIVNKLRLDCKELAIESDNREFIQNAYYNFAISLNKWFEQAFKGAVIVKN